MTDNENTLVDLSASTDFSLNIDVVIPKIVEHCQHSQISNNPVEILRYMQTQLVHGRALDVTNVAECETGATSYILVDRKEILETSFDEMEAIANKFLTLEVQFYGEVRNNIDLAIILLSMNFPSPTKHTHTDIDIHVQ